VPDFMQKGGGARKILNEKSSLIPIVRIISKGGKNYNCFF
jgi:hypothetical protein